jgi:hypothetical protein
MLWKYIYVHNIVMPSNHLQYSFLLLQTAFLLPVNSALSDNEKQSQMGAALFLFAPGDTWVFNIPSVTMTDTDEDGWDGDSSDDEHNEECHDEVVVVEALGSSGSAKPILRFPERNTDDTAGTRADSTKSVSDKNKVKSDDMTKVRQRKELLSKEVPRIEQALFWTDGCGTKSNLGYGTRFQQSSLSETSVRPSTSGYR